MPWEDIGECGIAEAPDERDRMVAEVELGCRYVRLVCGEPPDGCEVGVMWHEHDLGSYATVGLCWEFGERSDAPWEYISRAEDAISRLMDTLDWSPIPGGEKDGEEDEGEDDAEEDEETERIDTGEPPIEVMTNGR